MHLELCPFPQPSTERNPNPVTNDLYREFRKEQARYVRELSNAGSYPESEAKSLFQNILAVSPYASRFYGQPPYPRTRKGDKSLDAQVRLV
jgi:hypothetical protein